MKKFILSLLISLLIGTVYSADYTLTITKKDQNVELKKSGIALYTIEYTRDFSSKSNKFISYTYTETDNLSADIQYRGSIDKIIIFPDNFANVGDIICKTNISGIVYLYATSKPIESTESILEKLKKRRMEE